MYSGSPSYSGPRRKARPAGFRSPFVQRFSQPRKRRSLVWTTVLIACIFFIIQTFQLILQGESDIFSQEDLQHILLEHGIANKAMIPENLDWFRTYLSRLKRLMRKSRPIEKTDEQRLRERLANLNKMDMPMHKVDGVRVPCLDLLPEEEVATLSLPDPLESPIKSLEYFRLEEDAVNFEDSLFDPGRSGGAEEERPWQDLDVFAGKQTWFEREESFKLKPHMVVHCGFAGPHTGFDISLEDRLFMHSCTSVVSTCNFGGGDDLAQPIGMLNSSLNKVCFVAFWDSITVAVTEASGERVDPFTHKYGLWRVVVVHNLPFSDQRRNGKIPKMLAHRLFPQARFSIWVDAKAQFRRDPLAVLEALLWRPPRAELAISEHGARSCVFEEGEAIVAKRKAQPEEVAAQLFQYKLEGLPENLTLPLLQGHKALAEASVIVREHTPLTNLMMCLWFNEVVRFSARDQISFPYVLRRLHPPLRPRFFPVCTRRALVNSLGHRRKAKVKVKAKSSAQQRRARLLKTFHYSAPRHWRLQP